MVLGIAEDFTKQVALDEELTLIPSNGIYLNSGVHPMVNLSNLLAFLPIQDYTFENYNAATEYQPYRKTRNTKSIVIDNGNLYQCIQTSQGNAVSNTDYWLETNIDSLRLKTFVYKVYDKVFSNLSIENRLIDNQYLYELGEFSYTPEGDYFGWVIEPKNSDYVRLTINELSLQNTQSGPVNVYVVNQGQLIDTLVIQGGNGVVNFERTDYSFYGKGVFHFLIESEEILRKNKFVDWLRYDGFVAYPVTANGLSWDALNVRPSGSANGVGLNISATLDSDIYILNNLKNLASYVRSTFEYMTFQVFAQNSNSRLNAQVRDQLDSKVIMAELKDKDTDTVLTRYTNQRKEALNAIKKTFDKHLFNDNEGLTVTVGSI